MSPATGGLPRHCDPNILALSRIGRCSKVYRGSRNQTLPEQLQSRKFIRPSNIRVESCKNERVAQRHTTRIWPLISVSCQTPARLYYTSVRCPLNQFSLYVIFFFSLINTKLRVYKGPLNLKIYRYQL